MPFKSEKQRRYLWAKHPEIARKWTKEHGSKPKKAEAEFAPGLPEKGKITPLPKVKKPETWEFSAHPHEAEHAGRHIDLRLGNPATGIAHSFVLPKGELPEPGKSRLLIPTSDHTVEYQDFTGPITAGYGKGRVTPGRRTKVDVYHAVPGDEPGTKVRFNLYDAAHPQEYAIVRDPKGKHLLVNKTLTRERRPDIPDFKPKYREQDINDAGVLDEHQVLMPKLDGAHTLVELQAGRSPRLFSYRVGKRTPTGLIEHTHKVPKLLETKVPKVLDRTILRSETIGVDDKGKWIPVERIGGLLNAKVWQSRKKQEDQGVRLKVFPFTVEQYRGKNVADLPYEEKRSILDRVLDALPDLGKVPVAETIAEKLDLLNAVKGGTHSLTSEGVVSVDPGRAPEQFTKAKIRPDYDVHVRRIIPNREHPERAGAVSYSWTPKGRIVGTLGGFRHDEARDMLENPKQYLGRVVKVEASKVFKKGDELGALYQPAFKEWHLDKGEVMDQEKTSDMLSAAARARVWARNAARTLGGSNIEDVAGKHYQQVLKSPAVQSYRRDYPKHMQTTEGFFEDVIRGKKEVPWAEELPRQTKGRLRLLDELEEAAAAVKGERGKTTKARRILTGAVALPTAAAGTYGTVKTSAAKKSKLKAVAKEVAPALAGAGMGTAPIVQGLRTGALSLEAGKGRQFKDVAELRRNLTAGDVILTSAPGRGGKWKPAISALGGDPFGYHVEVVSDVPKGGPKRRFSTIHSTPGEGGAVERTMQLVPDEDIIIRRHKDPSHAKGMLKNVKERALRGDVLEELLGQSARAELYDKQRATMASLKSFLPQGVAKLIPSGRVTPGNAVCSSLPGMASPVCLVPGVAGEDVLPHHVRRSKQLETIGHYRAARNLPQRMFERSLQAAPWLVRGALGAGLGYGAYRGAKALMGD